MLAEEDSSRRFDYLFEPLDSADEPEVDAPPAVVAPRRDQRAAGMSFSALVAVAVVVAIGAVGALVQRAPRDEDVVPIPSTTVPSAVVAPSPLPPPAAPPPAVVPPVPPSAVITPRQAPSRVAPAPPSVSPPERRVTPTPTLRTPMSVAPETRQPFPDQPQRRDGGNPRDGGLLGIGGPGGLL